MSWQAVTWATQCRVGDSALKLLLLTLANYANTDDECWYPQKRIAFDTEIPERTLRRKMGALVDMGLIEITPRTRSDGGQTTSMVRLLVPPNQVQTPPQAKMAAPPAIAVPSLPATKVAAQDSSLNHHIKQDTRTELPFEENKPKPAKKRCTLPEIFPMTARHKRYAAERGIGTERADDIFDNFKSHHTAKGSTMIDWDAAWQTWVGNEVKFSAARLSPKAASQSGYGDDWW